MGDRWERAQAFWKTSRLFATLLLILWAIIATALLCFNPSRGIAIGLLAAVAGIMSLRPPEMHIVERFAWIAILVALTVAEVVAIGRNEASYKEDQKTLNQSLGNSNALLGLSQQQLILLQNQSRSAVASEQQKNALTKAWGKASLLNNKSVDGAVATPEQPAKIQQGKRFVDSEALGLALRSGVHGAATVINDGNYEAGALANQ